jgi:hypothetical protein
MYLELRPGPVSREHARPQPPAGSPPVRSTEEGQRQRSQPRCRSGSPATEPRTVPEPSGPGAKLDPPDHTAGHTQPNPAPHTQTEPRGRTAANTAAYGPSNRAAGRRGGGGGGALGSTSIYREKVLTSKKVCYTPPLACTLTPRPSKSNDRSRKCGSTVGLRGGEVHTTHSEASYL